MAQLHDLPPGPPELQSGAYMLDLKTHPSHETGDKVVIVDALEEFAANGGSIVELDPSKGSYGEIIHMTERPEHFANFPYVTIGKREDADSLRLIIVDDSLDINPETIIEHGGRESMRATSYVFPEKGLILDSRGLSEELELDQQLASLVHQELEIPYYKLHSSLKRWSVKRLTKAIERRRLHKDAQKEFEELPPPQAVMRTLLKNYPIKAKRRDPKTANLRSATNEVDQPAATALADNVEITLNQPSAREKFEAKEAEKRKAVEKIRADYETERARERKEKEEEKDRYRAIAAEWLKLDEETAKNQLKAAHENENPDDPYNQINIMLSIREELQSGELTQKRRLRLEASLGKYLAKD